MGIFVLWAAKQATQGKVIAIEPTSAIDVLRMNVERNGLTNVVPIQAAAGNDGGIVRDCHVSGLQHREPSCRVEAEDVDEVFHLAVVSEISIGAGDGAGVGEIAAEDSG